MSLGTYKKKSLIQKQQEQSEREKRTSELLTCEKQLSEALRTTITGMQERHALQLKKLEQENDSMTLLLEDSEDGVQIMQSYLHELAEQHINEVARLEYKHNELMQQKEEEFKKAELHYKSVISDLEKKLNVAEIEISYLKNYKKPQIDAMVQTSSEAATQFSAQRTIPLSDHVAMIKSLKAEFYKEKFKIQEECQEKMSESSLKKESANEMADKRSFESYKLCEGSKIVATLEQQNSARNKKKMEELIEYYLKCLDEKNKQCCRQQDLIQKLQVVKKRQGNKIQEIMKSANQKNNFLCLTTRDFKIQTNKRDSICRP